MKANKKDETKVNEKDETTKFYKKQLVASNKYSRYKDLLNAVLKDDSTYSIDEVDELIENFMKGKVK